MMPAVCSEPSGWELTKDLMRSLFNPVSLDVKITAGKSSREVAFRPQSICIFCFKALNAPVTYASAPGSGATPSRSADTAAPVAPAPREAADGGEASGPSTPGQPRHPAILPPLPFAKLACGWRWFSCTSARQKAALVGSECEKVNVCAPRRGGLRGGLPASERPVCYRARRGRGPRAAGRGKRGRRAPGAGGTRAPCWRPASSPRSHTHTHPPPPPRARAAARCSVGNGWGWLKSAQWSFNVRHVGHGVLKRASERGAEQHSLPPSRLVLEPGRRVLRSAPQVPGSGRRVGTEPPVLHDPAGRGRFPRAERYLLRLR